MTHPIVKRYSNGEITVVWQPALCRHTGICARGLPLVFDPRRRPWVEVQHSDTETIVAQVARCPSGALSIERPTPDPAGPTPSPAITPRRSDRDS